MEVEDTKFKVTGLVFEKMVERAELQVMPTISF